MKTERELLKEYINYVLTTHRLVEAVEVHETLNPLLWDNMELKEDVYEKLLEIAHTFIDNLGFPIDVVDIRIVGSNASYNYNSQSDIDLHIISNFDTNYVDNTILQQLYNNEKNIFNSKHEISIHDIPVELYVEDMNSINATNGSYSLQKKEWVKVPQPITYEIPDYSKELNIELKNIDEALKSEDKDVIKQEINNIYLMRKDGLADKGEASIGNLVFKELRNLGAIKELTNRYYEIESEDLSLESEEINKENLIKIIKEIDKSIIQKAFDGVKGSLNNKCKSKRQYLINYINENDNLDAIYYNLIEGQEADNYKIFQIIKTINPNAKFENYRNKPTKQVLAILGSYRKEKDKEKKEEIEKFFKSNEYKEIVREIERNEAHPKYYTRKDGTEMIRNDAGGYEEIDESNNLNESEQLNEYTLHDVMDDSQTQDPARVELSKSIYSAYDGVDSDGTLIFKSDSQTRSGKVHTQRIFYPGFFDLLDKADNNEKITDEDVVNILTSDLMLDCSCESFLYWAWAYKSWKKNYGLMKELRAPKRNNIHLHGGACKHLLSVLELINRSDSLFDKIAEDLNTLFQSYKKRPNNGNVAPEPPVEEPTEEQSVNDKE